MTSLLAQWRKARRLDDVAPEYRHRLPVQPHDRQRRTLTQDMVAAMAGVSSRHYINFERRGGRGFSPRVIADISGILGADDDQQEALYRWADQSPPRKETANHQVSPALRRRLEAHPYPGILIGHATWDVLAYNEQAAAALPAIAMAGANLARLVLDGPTRNLLVEWEVCARPVLAALRMAVSSPVPPPELVTVLRGVLRAPDTRRLWEESAEVRAHLDGIVVSMNLPTISRSPVTVEIQSWTPERRPELRMLVIVPLAGRREEIASPARSIPSAQRLADSVLTLLDAAAVTVNYTIPTRPAPPGYVDVALRRAAISCAEGRPVPRGFLLPGESFPPLPARWAIEHHRAGGCVHLRTRTDLLKALGNEPHLIRAIVPGADITGVAHSPLITPEGTVVGSVEAFPANGQVITEKQLDALRYQASVRAAAIGQELEATGR
jgi:hypothetical protein